MVTVNPVKELQPVLMTERGKLTKCYGRAFVAGVLPYKVRTCVCSSCRGQSPLIHCHNKQ